MTNHEERIVALETELRATHKRVEKLEAIAWARQWPPEPEVLAWSEPVPKETWSADSESIIDMDDVIGDACEKLSDRKFNRLAHRVFEALELVAKRVRVQERERLALVADRRMGDGLGAMMDADELGKWLRDGGV